MCFCTFRAFCLKTWPITPLHSKTLAWNVCFHKRKVDTNIANVHMSDEHIQRFELCFKIKIPSINLQGGENIGAAFNGTMLASCFLSLFDVLLLFEPLCVWVNKGCSFMSILLCYLLCRYCSSDDVS